MKNLKRILFLSILFFIFTGNVFAESSKYDLVVVVNDKVLTSTADYMYLKPMKDIHGNVFVDFYQATDALNCEVSFDSEKEVVVAKSGDHLFELDKKGDTKKLYINGKRIQSPTPLYVDKNGFTSLNMKLLADELGVKVSWSEDKKIMYIYTDEYLKEKAEKEKAEKEAQEGKALTGVPATGEFEGYLKISGHKYEDLLDIYVRVDSMDAWGQSVLKKKENMSDMLTCTEDGVAKTQSRKSWYRTFDLMSSVADYNTLRDYYGDLYHHWYIINSNFAALAVASDYQSQEYPRQTIPTSSLHPGYAGSSDLSRTVADLKSENIHFSYVLPENFISKIKIATKYENSPYQEVIDFTDTPLGYSEFKFTDMITGETIFSGTFKTSDDLELMYSSNEEISLRFKCNEITIELITQNMEETLNYLFKNNIEFSKSDLISKKIITE